MNIKRLKKIEPQPDGIWGDSPSGVLVGKLRPCNLFGQVLEQHACVPWPRGTTIDDWIRRSVRAVKIDGEYWIVRVKQP